MSDVSAPPPGWFPDPYGAPGLLRWWDGQQWTQATQPAAGYGYAQRATPGYGGPSQPGFAPSQPGFAPSQPAFAPPPPAKTRNGALPWMIGTAGLAVVAVLAVVVVFALRGKDDPKNAAAPPAASATASSPAGDATPTAPTAPGNQSVVIGRITDSKLGISYARLAPPWTPASGSWLRPDYFSDGQVSVVQAPFEQYESFNATSLSGPPRPDESVGYADPRNLSVPGRRVAQRILREHFNLENRRTTLFSGPYRAAGRPGWLERYRLEFTDAKARGWKFSADTVAILVLDLGNRRLGLLWVSVPDTFPHQGDIDLVLTSVQVP